MHFTIATCLISDSSSFPECSPFCIVVIAFSWMGILLSWFSTPACFSACTKCNSPKSTVSPASLRPEVVNLCYDQQCWTDFSSSQYLWTAQTHLTTATTHFFKSQPGLHAATPALSTSLLPDAPRPDRGAGRARSGTCLCHVNTHKSSHCQ